MQTKRPVGPQNPPLRAQIEDPGVALRRTERTSSAKAAAPANGVAAAQPNKAAERAIGHVAAAPKPPRYDYDQLGKPNNIDEAFDTLLCSGAGPAKVRRFADDNPGAWNMVLDLLRRAEKSFDFSFFTIEKEAYGFSFLGGCLHKAMTGVEVSGITDWSANSRGRGFVSAGLGYDYFQELAAYGAKIGVFNTPMKRLERFTKYGLDYGLIGCDHDKVIVKDKGTPKAEGETGGRNIAGAYHQDPKDNEAAWRDDTVHIVGQQACDGFAKAIDREFAGPAMKMVKPDLVNLNVRAREMLAGYALMEEWVARPVLTEAEKQDYRDNPAKRLQLADQLFDAANARLGKMIAALPAAVQQKIPEALSGGEEKYIRKLARELTKDLELCGSRAAYEARDGFVDGEVKIIDQTGAADAPPGQRFNEIAPDLVHLFHGAREEIIIQNPYVVLTEEMVQALEEAAQRGVKIKVVTNSPASTDSAVTQGFFLADWPSILARVPTMELFVATGKRKFHAKCFAMDGKVTGDMSFNADLLSGLVNGEIGAITRSPASAADLKARIEADLANPANGFKQWRIQKDENGRAVLGPDKKPIVLQGPEQDISKKLRMLYVPVQALCEVIRATDAGAPLRHQPVDEVLAKRDW